MATTKLTIPHVRAPGFFSVVATNLLISSPTPSGMVQITFVNEMLNLSHSVVELDGDSGLGKLTSPLESTLRERELVGRVSVSPETARELLRHLTDAIAQADAASKTLEGAVPDQDAAAK